MYQAIDAGLPVVVGENPSMKSVVEDLKVGVSVNTDGSNISLIEKGIKEVLNKRDVFIENIKHLTDEIKWESQEPSLKKAIDILLTNCK